MRIFQRIAAWFKAVWRMIMALPKGITNAVPVSGEAESPAPRLSRRALTGFILKPLTADA